jgi:ABC-type glycerol-3-phosphate transport system substrate-binding protein
MKKTKLIYLIAVMLIMVLTFSACQPQGGESSTVPTSSDSQSSSADPTTEPEPQRDFGGAEFTIASHWAVYMFPEVGASDVGDKMLNRYTEIEEKYNCTISYITGTPEEFNNGFTSAAAAGLKYADVIETNLFWLRPFVAAGYLEPLENVEDLKLEDDATWLGLAKTASTFEGKTYGVDWTTWYNKLPNVAYILYFNKRLLEEKNQPNPYELFDKGEWNWENFREIAKNVSDPVNEIDGIVGLDMMIEMSAIRSNGVREVNVDENGKYLFGLADERAYEALEFVKNIIHVDKSYGDYYDGRSMGVAWTLPITRFLEGQAGFLSYHTHMFEFGFLLNMVDDYGFIPFPRGPKGRSDYNAALTAHTRTFSIPVTVEDKDMAGFILRQIAQPLEGSTADSWKENAQRVHFRDQEGFEHYYKSVQMADKDYYEVFGPINLGETIQRLLSVTRDRSATPAEAIGGLRSLMQIELDEAFNK